MPNQGALRMCQEGTVFTFQVVGRGTMNHSLPLRRRAEEVLALSATALRVDLRYCTYMDSTFLGTLLYLMRTVKPAEFALVCPSPECQQLLQQMKLDTIYPTMTATEPDCWSEVFCDSSDIDTFRCNVVQAHQLLADLPGPAGEPFRWLATKLGQELEAGKK